MPDTSTHTNLWIDLLAFVALFTPLVSSLITSLIPARYSWVASLTAPVLMLIGTGAAALLLYSSWATGPYAVGISWFSIGANTISAGLYINNLSALMVLMVTVVSFLVHVYSTGYMAGDQAFRRYFAMLGFFTFSMLGIVLADNLLLIFVFWELVGFSSYMLIGHWTEQASASQAAIKAFVMNRIGDLGFLTGLLIIYSQTGTFQIAVLQETQPVLWQTAASLCIFCGVIGKSAQFPLLTWLPDAMAGPTPVSALIHAATMVAAGVFLLARVFFLFTPLALNVVAVTGVITSLIGAIAALSQYDIKKILAYSTISQLGFMVLAIGAGSKESSTLHLFTHAFFKAGLFLGAGSVIHTLHMAQHGSPHQFDVQDIRNTGSLRHKLPVTFLTFCICGASLAGLPFFSGFQSKDFILSSVINWAGKGSVSSWLIVIAAFTVSFLTVCYTFRLIWFVFIRKDTSGKIDELDIKEAPWVMRFPMIVLSMASCWWIVSWNPFSFSGWLNEAEGSHLVALLSGGWALLALVLVFIYFKNKSLKSYGDSSSNVLLPVFFLDTIYRFIIVRPIHKLAALTLKVDKKWIDGFIHMGVYAQVTLAHVIGWCDKVFIDGTVNGMARLAGGLGAFTRSFQGGKIQYYILWAALGLTALLLLLIV